MDKHTFENTKSGRSLNKDDFEALAEPPGAGAARAGSTTIKRGSLVRSLLREERQGGGNGLLESIAVHSATAGHLPEEVISERPRQPTKPGLT